MAVHCCCCSFSSALLSAKLNCLLACFMKNQHGIQHLLGLFSFFEIAQALNEIPKNQCLIPLQWIHLCTVVVCPAFLRVAVDILFLTRLATSHARTRRIVRVLSTCALGILLFSLFSPHTRRGRQDLFAHSCSSPTKTKKILDFIS